MVCVFCFAKITATLTQAKMHEWRIWIGGACCKACQDAGRLVIETRDA